MTWPAAKRSIDGVEMSDEDDAARPRKRRPFKRLHSASKARCNDVYNVAEIRKLYGVEEQTIYNWIREGLIRVPGISRLLVRGDHLNAFHAARRERAKRPLGPTEFLCFVCKIQREPAPHSVIGVDPACPGLRLEARCLICGTQMFRPWSRRSADALRSLWNGCTDAPNDTAPVLSGRAQPQRRVRRPATDSDSTSQSHSCAPEQTPQTAGRPANTIGSDQTPLQLGFWPQEGM